MAEHFAEKTEPSTPRRRQEARREGNVARSADLTAACMLLGALVLLHALGLKLHAHLRGAMETLLSPAGENPARVGDTASLLGYTGRVMLAAAGPLVLGITAVGLLAGVAQVGPLLTTKPLEPSLARLSPARGLARLFGAAAGARLAMSLLKIGVVGAAAWAAVMQDLPLILVLPELELGQLVAAASQLVYALALKLAALLLVLGLIDYAFQRRGRERDLRMTRQEVKEELRRMEGDPLVKQRRTRVARELALQRIGAAVPGADLVVTNPTHYAVALRYESDAMRAPRVVAKGADFLALRIRQIASASGVPMVERRELAQSLYKSVEVGREVPGELYAAVAECLAYVYRLSERKTA